MRQIEALPFPDYQQPQVIDVLEKAAINELLTCTLYKHVENSAARANSARLRHMAGRARQEDWHHYQVLLECIDHLQKDHPPTAERQIPQLIMPDVASTEDLLWQIEEAEKASIAYQNQICAMTLGYDYKVFDQAYALLNENMQHNRLVNACIRGEG